MKRRATYRAHSAQIERDTAVAIILANVFTVLIVVGSLVTAA
jgi:hypothetical protein